jgi:hypothetical protein
MGRVAPFALVLLAAGLLAAAAGAAERAAPAGPTLSLVALSPKDVGGGARTVRQRSLRSTGYVAAFERELEFRGGAVGSSVLFYLTSTVELARLPGTPRAELAGVRKQLSTKAGRVEMVRNIEGELRQDLGDTLKAAAMGTVLYPKIGAGAIVVPIAVTTTSSRLQLVLTYLQVDRLLVTTSLAGNPVARADVERLLRVTAGKARVQLGPVNVSLPTIAGEARAGAQLTASSGSWRNAPTGYAYRWRRCDTTGNACTSLPGATLATYTASATDVGATLRVIVTARNAAGKVDAVSPPTAPVAPA